MVSEILSLIVMGELEQFNIQSTSAVVLFTLLVSFVILSALSAIQWALGRRSEVKG